MGVHCFLVSVQQINKKGSYFPINFFSSLILLLSSFILFSFENLVLQTSENEQVEIKFSFKSETFKSFEIKFSFKSFFLFLYFSKLEKY